ncbi:hypothetical protein [Holospora undulata]|uniref:Uncharacterized protein n=1 Tax=Holospora undulata HU1 TaxID=1321371 RepID=A0A061JGT8_9PROT|nr:hypothetical protein [Holospora undulata]ETZ05300.1 hypothetical protein K737_300268 [Holospora undulata HU1]
MNKICKVFLCTLILTFLNSSLYADGEEKNSWISKVIKEQVPQGIQDTEAIHAKINAALKDINDPVLSEDPSPEEQRAKDFFKEINWSTIVEEDLNKKVKEFLEAKKEERIPEKSQDKQPEKDQDPEEVLKKIENLEKINTSKRKELADEEEMTKALIQSIKDKVAKLKLPALKDKIENIVSEVGGEIAEKVQGKILPTMFETVKKISTSEFHTALERNIFSKVKKLIIENQKKFDQEIESMDKNELY